MTKMHVYTPVEYRRPQLKKCRYELIQHVSYSAIALAPTDYHLFRNLKEDMQGEMFQEGYGDFVSSSANSFTNLSSFEERYAGGNVTRRVWRLCELMYPFTYQFRMTILCRCGLKHNPRSIMLSFCLDLCFPKSNLQPKMNRHYHIQPYRLLLYYFCQY